MLTTTVVAAFFSIVIADPIRSPIHTVSKSSSLEIVNGDPAKIEDHPYTVNIEFEHGENCVGTIFTPTSVVTTASCAWRVYKKNWQAIVRAGSSSSGQNGSEHEINELAIHAKWDGYYSNDIGLIIVADPFAYDETRQAMKLYGQDEEIPEGVSGIISGWGSTGQLETLNVTVLNQSECQSIHANFDATQEICARNIEDSEKVECNGDEGAPLVINGRLAAIVSRYSGYCERIQSTVYVNIAHYHDWLENAMI